MAPQKYIPPRAANYLRLAAAGVLIGMGLRGMLHDLPLRALFWDASWWTWFAHMFGFTWKEWVTSARVDQWINVIDFSIGAFLTATGLMILLANRFKSFKRMLPFAKLVFVAAWFFLLIQYFLNFKEAFWQAGNLLEHSLQMIALPLWFFVLLVNEFGRSGHKAAPGQREGKGLLWVIRLAIALTFIGHGFYAAGVHPVPANFVLMTQSGLGVGESAARSMLLLVGILDFLAAGLLLLPWKKAWVVALGWIIPWAILTTLARLWSYGGLVDSQTLITQWIPEVIIRLPHVFVPLALWTIIRVRSASSVEARPQVQGKLKEQG
ncbi:hypothetical protein [Neolewinella agarilytica]|uniref:Uncharacterized protein n=1 Tax=Neolewinella agarilytica TaxID=478744 RepID=A0A1H9CZ34_9BACT|nr:hypothetical protein [Neolewinella agarilytica]SEQ06397.1 hypothetical protein SAMN05444359_10574 [Neolewinella agarilytica]